jgi:hypothetical protein
MSNERFMHEGRHLREWLLQLVEEEPERRNRAAQVIENQFCFPQDLSGHHSHQKLYQEFSAAAKAVLQEADLPATEFVKKLLTLHIRLETEDRPEPAKRAPEEEAWLQEMLQKAKGMNSDAGYEWLFREVNKEYPKRFPNHTPQEPSQEQKAGGVVANVVRVFDVELLPAAEELRVMLKQGGTLALTAYGVISGMGRTGLVFYPELIEGLGWHSLGEDPGFTFHAPLGYWLREVPEKIPEIIKFCGSENALVQDNAIRALGYAGREVMRSYPDLEERGLTRLREGDETERRAWAWTLGEIAERPEAVERLLEATMPPDQPHTAEAIEALGKLGQGNQMVVARLIALLPELRKLPKNLRNRSAQRHCATALAKLGDKAGIPELARMIWTEPVENIDEHEQVVHRPVPDQDVIKALGSFGAEAKEVLPALQLMKEEMLQRARKEGYIDCDMPGYIEGCPDYLAEAISSIEGK